jgi:hypothetical protein
MMTKEVGSYQGGGGGGGKLYICGRAGGGGGGGGAGGGGPGETCVCVLARPLFLPISSHSLRAQFQAWVPIAGCPQHIATLDLIRTCMCSHIPPHVRISLRARAALAGQLCQWAVICVGKLMYSIAALGPRPTERSPRLRNAAHGPWPTEAHGHGHPARPGPNEIGDAGAAEERIALHWHRLSQHTLVSRDTHTAQHTLVSRLLPLRADKKPKAPSCIDEAVMHVAHAAIFDAERVVYGGFLRDWVVRGETAGDVDVRTSDYDETEQAMSTALQEFSIFLSDSQPWGQKKNYRRLQYTWQGNAIYVDLVNPILVPLTPPGVDCDVGNLQLDKHNGFHLKVPLVSLATSIKHGMSKKFVLFYDLSACRSRALYPFFKTVMCKNHPNCRYGDRCIFAHGSEELRKLDETVDGSELAGRRLEKYIKRGWICKSHVPPDVASRLGLSTKQLKPKEKYLKPYWQMPPSTRPSGWAALREELRKSEEVEEFMKAGMVIYLPRGMEYAY